jgi:hypothetical protein
MHGLFQVFFTREAGLFQLLRSPSPGHVQAQMHFAPVADASDIDEINACPRVEILSQAVDEPAVQIEPSRLPPAR